MAAIAINSSGTARLNKGDVLVCCTDGILEISDEHQQEYGTDRLGACVRRNLEKTAQGILDAIVGEVSGYSTASMSSDDKVLMVMKVASDAVGN